MPNSNAGPGTDPATTTRSFLDPESPFGLGGLIVAGLLSAVLALLWWGVLHIAHCGIDAGGGPPGPPAPSTFGRLDLMYAAGGALIATLPLMLASRFIANQRLSTAARRGAAAVAFVIAILALRHIWGGATYWLEAC